MTGDPHVPAPAEGTRLGLLGGTFDPPHRGHLEVARAAMDEAGLTRLLLVPARVPYHKKSPRAAFDHRAAMAARLAAEDPRLGVCLAERDGEGASYTVDLLARFRAAGHRREDLAFVIGADSLEDLPGWREYTRLFELATLVAVFRPGHSLAGEGLAPELLAQVVKVPGVALDISSTDLRARLARGEEPEEVPEGVRAYAREAGLYAGRG